MPLLQFLRGGIVFFDVPDLIGLSVFVQPLLCLFAGGAFRVFINIYKK